VRGIRSRNVRRRFEESFADELCLKSEVAGFLRGRYFEAGLGAACMFTESCYSYTKKHRITRLVQMDTNHTHFMLVS
jgi:hypothetical protein